MLDGRSYRSDQPCGDPFIGPDCADRTDPANTMLGDHQERWLVNGLRRSQARWNVLVNQTIFAPTTTTLPGDGPTTPTSGTATP